MIVKGRLRRVFCRKSSCTKYLLTCLCLVPGTRSLSTLVLLYVPPNNPWYVPGRHPLLYIYCTCIGTLYSTTLLLSCLLLLSYSTCTSTRYYPFSASGDNTRAGNHGRRTRTSTSTLCKHVMITGGMKYCRKTCPS